MKRLREDNNEELDNALYEYTKRRVEKLYSDYVFDAEDSNEEVLEFSDWLNEVLTDADMEEIEDDFYNSISD